MLRAVIALIALGVNQLTEKEASKGPQTVTINVPNPDGNSGAGGGEIYVP